MDWNQSDSELDSDEIENQFITSSEEDEQQEPDIKGKDEFFKFDKEDDSDDVRIVRTAQEKRYDDIRKAILKIESAMKNEDWNSIGTEWESLIRAVSKAKQIIDQTGYPKFYLSFLCDLDDKINSMDKQTIKSMKSKKAFHYNTTKRQFKKYLKESKNVEELLEKFRKNPNEFEDPVEREPKKKNPFLEDTDDDKTTEEESKTTEEQPWTPERVNKILQDMIKDRGKKTYVTSQVHEHIKTYRSLLTKVDGIIIQLTIRFRLINAMFDSNIGTSHLNINTWKRIYNELVICLDTIFDNPTIRLEEEPVPEEGKEKSNTIYGHLLFSIEKLHEEFIRSLQNIDSHTQDYLIRLSHERDFLLLLQYAEKHYEKVNDKKRLAAIALRQLDYLYYKRQGATGIEDVKVPKDDEDDNEEESTHDNELDEDSLIESTPEAAVEQSIELIPPSSSRVTPYTNLTDTVSRLANIVYKHSEDRPPKGESSQKTATDIDQQKRRAMLLHVYHLALHDQYSKGRDLLLMTHLPEKIHQARTQEQVMYNRALTQLGLAAFREGRIEDSCNCLQDILQTSKDKAKELLAQGITHYTRNTVEKNTEQEKQERKRQIPYHMHINLDLIEGVLLISGMLIEIPMLAQARLRPDRDSKYKKTSITKYFRKSFDFYTERQLFTGPPENTKEAIIVAAKSLERGDWSTCRDIIKTLDLWKFFQENSPVMSIISRHIQEQALRTYLISHAQYYDTGHISTLSEMFSIPPREVNMLVSTMMMRGELHASLDQPSGAIIVHAQDPTPLQQVALIYADKANALLESGEQVETKSTYERKWTEQRLERNQKPGYQQRRAEGQFISRGERQFQTKRKGQRGRKL